MNFLNKVKSTISTLNQQLHQNDLVITEIAVNLYHINFPKIDQLRALRKHVNHADYQLWNLSEYPYEPNVLETLNKDSVHHLQFEYYSTIPMVPLLDAVDKIASFLKADPNNKVYVHCQDKKIRSAIFFSAYLFLTQLQEDMGKAIIYVNNRLSMRQEERVDQQEMQNNILYQAQHLAMKNIVNYITDSTFINTRRLKIIKILVTNLPKLMLQSKVQQQPNLLDLSTDAERKFLLEIRCENNVVHRKIYTLNSQTMLSFKLHTSDIAISDDFLIIIKYIQNKQAHSMIRLQANSNFIFNQFLRVHQQSLDIANLNRQNCKLYVDVLFEDIQGSQSELSWLGKSKEQNKEGNGKESISEGKSEARVESPAKSSRSGSDDYRDEFNILGEDEEKVKEETDNIQMVVQKTIQNLAKEDQASDEDNEEEDLDDYLSKLEKDAENH